MFGGIKKLLVLGFEVVDLSFHLSFDLMLCRLFYLVDCSIFSGFPFDLLRQIDDFGGLFFEEVIAELNHIFDLRLSLLRELLNLVLRLFLILHYLFLEFFDLFSLFDDDALLLFHIHVGVFLLIFDDLVKSFDIVFELVVLFLEVFKLYECLTLELELVELLLARLIENFIQISIDAQEVLDLLHFFLVLLVGELQLRF